MQHVQAAAAADYCFQQHLAGMRGHNFADDGCVVAVGELAEEGDGLVGDFRGDEGEQFAFIGEIERVNAEQVAGPLHVGADRQGGFADNNADL